MMTLIQILPLFILAFWRELGLKVGEAFYILIGWAMAVALLKISRLIERGIEVVDRGIAVRILRSNPDDEEEGIKTSGAGTFAGMIVGGAIGLSFGPVGVLICGILGALLGDRAEYETLKAEKKEKRT